MMTARDLELLRFWMSVGLLGCAALFYMCLVPSPPTVGFPYIDKIEHFVAYLVLGTWFAGILAPRYGRVFFGLLAFGIFIEIVQAVSGWRDGEIGDVVADGLGVAAGIGLAYLGAMDWLGYIDRRVAAKRNRTG